MPDHAIALLVLCAVTFYAAAKEFIADNRRDARLAAVLASVAGAGAAAAAWFA